MRREVKENTEGAGFRFRGMTGTSDSRPAVGRTWSRPPDRARLTPGARFEASGLRRRFVRDALFGEQIRQFPRLEHLGHDVAAADEVALHVELRNRRPVGKL